MTQDIWLHFTQEQLQQYLGLLDDPDAAAGFLAETLALPEYRFDARQAIRLDYASYVLQFAREQGYGPARTASLFNIAHQVLEACIGGASYADCEQTFKGLMLSAVSPRPAADSPQFSPDQVAKVATFMASGVFRHYRLYQYVFTQEQGHTEFTADLLVETPVIQTFELALSETEWEAHHAKIREEAEAAHKAAEDAEAGRLAEEERLAEGRRRVEAEERRKAELARKPATLEEAIEHLVAVRLEAEKELLASEYKAKEDQLLAKISTLEISNKVQAGGGKQPTPGSAGAKK